VSEAGEFGVRCRRSAKESKEQATTENNRDDAT